ncbi:unnamed protein product [Spirodela intermedia]|uniref:Uncharacterized protein n=1 Tax=Spirodela intermedia TaxID=51605 RepID=A0ABN7ED55_SPIIN|nr:unnamed protein product [Spirodela intermedia]
MSGYSVLCYLPETAPIVALSTSSSLHVTYLLSTFNIGTLGAEPCTSVNTRVSHTP